MDRVIVYVDGFNLYYGLKSKKWRYYYWLNIHELSKNLLESDQNLAEVHYFSTRITDNGRNSQKRKRQKVYFEALETLPDTNLHFGHYLAKKQKCWNCKTSWRIFEEKMTDVKIAVQLLNDAQDNKFDTAIIISADSDLVPPIEAVLQRYQCKRVIVAFPPNRNSNQLRIIATAYLTIGRKKLKDSQLPYQIKSTSGYMLSKPREWG